LSDYFTSTGFLNKRVLAPQCRNYGLFSPGIDEGSSEICLLSHAWLQLLSLSLFEFREALSFIDLHFTGNKKGAIGALVWFIDWSEWMFKILSIR